MSRTLKFRSWIKAENKMFYDFTMLENNRMSDNGKTILMQFTGLNDNKGNSIYEGDIVRFYGGSSHYGVYEFDIMGKVVFDGGCFCLEHNNESSLLCDLMQDFQCEVVGNIYKMSELSEERE
jgi:uncharacterized phage protein (TIGR01671 family)